MNNQAFAIAKFVCFDIRNVVCILFSVRCAYMSSHRPSRPPMVVHWHNTIYAANMLRVAAAAHKYTAPVALELYYGLN